MLSLIWKPGGEFSDGGRGQVEQQLCEVELRIHVMAAAVLDGKAGQDCRRSATTRIAHEEASSFGLEPRVSFRAR